MIRKTWPSVSIMRWWTRPLFIVMTLWVATRAQLLHHPKLHRILQQEDRIIWDEYIVVLRKNQTEEVATLAHELVAPFAHDQSTVLLVFDHAFEGFSARLSVNALITLLEDNRVEFIEQVSTESTVGSNRLGERAHALTIVVFFPIRT